jgi:hypothetical protein
MKLYSYIVRYDIGFAPNPFYDWCTLATCKQDIRSRATVGDWIIGTGSKTKGLDGSLVYAMCVEETLNFVEYWNDPRFQYKKPNLCGSVKQRYGDNIYRKDAQGAWLQEDSRHSHADGSTNPGHVARDTKADVVLASTMFVYWGGFGPTIQPQFRNWDGVDVCASRPGYRSNFPDEMQDDFVGWLNSSAGAGYQGDPADW